MEYLTIALSKGRIAEESYHTFKKIGLGDCIDLDSRKLVFVDYENKLRFIYVKASDVITYVENGVADLGIVGKDTILESDTDVYEILDLGFGKCKFAVAGIAGACLNSNEDILKVATKYPNISKNYFQGKKSKD